MRRERRRGANSRPRTTPPAKGRRCAQIADSHRTAQRRAGDRTDLRPAPSYTATVRSRPPEDPLRRPRSDRQTRAGPGCSHRLASDRRDRRAAHRHLLQDADPHLVYDQPVDRTLWPAGLIPLESAGETTPTDPQQQISAREGRSCAYRNEAQKQQRGREPRAGRRGQRELDEAPACGLEAGPAPPRLTLHD
jgi:hypothetical protein